MTTIRLRRTDGLAFNTDHDGTRCFTADELVQEAIDWQASMHDGALEVAQAKVEALTGIVGRLLAELPTDAWIRVSGIGWVEVAK